MSLHLCSQRTSFLVSRLFCSGLRSQRRGGEQQNSSRQRSADLVQVIEIAFESLQPGDPLWPFSGQTLRARFRKVCQALGLPSSGSRKDKRLDLSSFRPGGATWLLQASGNPELVRRRGRWLSPKVMEIYIYKKSSLQPSYQTRPFRPEKELRQWHLRSARP